MPITIRDVRAFLDAEEVDYPKAKSLGPEAIPILLGLVRGGDLGLASKATFLASMIESDQSLAVLEAAAASSEPLLRVAAASGIRNLAEPHAERVLDLLRADPDAGIRKVVLASAGRLRSPQVAAKIQQMAETDPEPFVRELAASTVIKLRGPSQ